MSRSHSSFNRNAVNRFVFKGPGEEIIKITLAGNIVGSAGYAYAATLATTGLKGAAAAAIVGLSNGVFVNVAGAGAAAAAGVLTGTASTAYKAGEGSIQGIRSYLRNKGDSPGADYQTHELQPPLPSLVAGSEKAKSTSPQTLFGAGREGAIKGVSNYWEGNTKSKAMNDVLLGAITGFYIGAVAAIPYGFDLAHDIIVDGVDEGTESSHIYEPVSVNAEINREGEIYSLNWPEAYSP